jgi:hypothetical protein
VENVGFPVGILPVVSLVEQEDDEEDDPLLEEGAAATGGKTSYFRLLVGLSRSCWRLLNDFTPKRFRTSLVYKPFSSLDCHIKTLL